MNQKLILGLSKVGGEVKSLEIVLGRQRSREGKVGLSSAVWSANFLEQAQSEVKVEIFIEDDGLV